MASTSTSGRGEQERDPFLALQPHNKKIQSSLTAKQYDVFINHRGPDTKTILAKPLYDSLHQAGIPAYLDFAETELGDYFLSAIKNAIFSATLHIAILSPRYAESAWCLAELALMFRTKARIIPLFYHVDPSDFRYIKNGVADAFSKHQEKGRYPHQDIQQWKDCLQNISRIKGNELNGQNDDLNKLCKDIISAAVKEKQKRKIPFRVAKHEVGLGEIAKDFHIHCQRNGEMRDKIGIYGMGGSGKTTLAKYLFNHKHSEFSGSTYLFDVRENDVKRNLTSLQSKLLKDLGRKQNDHKFCSIEDGIANINDHLQKSQELKFLIVIDDVDHQRQLDALLPIDLLNPNSLVIVTTRDERLLVNAGVRVRYKMKRMNPQHSRELFCCHAFRGLSCKSGFEDLVDSFVEACGGLPLALRVLGGHVFGSDKAYWKLQLDVVKTRLDKDIRETLKISYDSLEEDEKQVFMDIACFFIGKDVTMVTSVWKALGWRVEHALQTLKDKCLAEVETCFNVAPRCHYEPRYFFRMHDQLRDLGRAMADNETSLPRRLWRPEDHIDMSAINGFQETLIESAGKSFPCYRSAREVDRILYSGRFRRDMQFCKGYFLEISKTSTYAQSLVLNNCDRLIEWIPEWISLQNLHSVSLHNLSPARLLERHNQVPLKLKELYFEFDYRFYAADLNEDTFIDGLVSSFGTFKHLESLHFQGCPDLDIIEWNRLLKSVKELTNLQTLDLRGVRIEGEFALSNREETTDDRLCMRSLEAITLCRVIKIRKVTIHGEFSPTLKSLKLCSMEDLIEVDLTRVTTLECLVLLQCGKLRKVSGNYMAKLEMFHIRKCCTMRELPNFERASRLKRVYISHCKELQDISGIERSTGLKRIWIADCPELKSITAIEQLKGLKRVWIQECPKLEGVICLKELKELKRIFIGGCRMLQNIQGIEHLNRLESIIITECPELQNISGIGELEGLKEMIIAVGPIISHVQRLQRLASECTILVGRLASDWRRDKWTSLMSELYEIGDILTVGNGAEAKEGNEAEDEEDETAAENEEDEDEEDDKWEEDSLQKRRKEMEDSVQKRMKRRKEMEDSLQKRIKEMEDSFHETQRSLSKLIICIVTCKNTGLLPYPKIGSSICNGSNICNKGGVNVEKWFDLSPGSSEYTLYMAIVDDCWRSKLDSWMLPSCRVAWQFIMGLEAGEERKTLRILQSVIAQLCVDDCYYSEDLRADDHLFEILPNFSCRFPSPPKYEYDELAEYADDNEKYDGSDDEEEYNVHVS